MQDRKFRSVPAVCGWAVVLVVLLPGLVLQSLDVRIGAAIALQCVVVLHTGGALARVLSDVTVRLMAFGFWLFAYVWLGLAPLAMLATDHYPWPYRTGENTAFTATALIEIGLLAYSAGTAIAGRYAKRHSVALEPLLSRTIAPVSALLLCGVALALAVVLIPRQGGVGMFFASREAIRNSGGTGPTHSLLAWVLAVPAFWALVALVHLPRPDTGGRFLRRTRVLVLPLLLVLNVIVNNPISRPRFWAGTVLLTLVFASKRLFRPQAFRVTAAVIVVSVLLVFPYSDYFRYENREEMPVISVAEQFTTNGDYDAYQQIQTGVDRVKDSGYAPKNALGAALFMVPRSKWHGKPEDTGIALASYAGYKFTNLSAPLWIESYTWGGVPSVLAVFALLGAAGRRVDDIRNRVGARRGTLAAVLVPAFAIYQLVFLRGSLMAIAGPLFLLLIIPLCITARAPRTSRSTSLVMPAASAVEATISGTGGRL